MGRLHLFVLLTLWGAIVSSGQIRMRVIMRNPAPAQLSVWQTDPSVAQVEISNLGDPIDAVRLSGEIRSSDGRIVASTNDDDRSIPRFSLPGKGKVTRLRGRDVLSTSAMRIDKTIAKMASQTNSLPEGDYTFCIRLLTDAGEQVDGSEEACGDVSIVIADPPQLMFPSEDQAVASEGLQFQWTQVQRSNVGGSVEYVLVVVPILGSESPSVAIERNEWLMQRRVQRNSYLMTGADRPLTVNGARKFAWRVRAVTPDGRPCTSNDGYSEVGTFRIEAARRDDDVTLRAAMPDSIVISGFRIAVKSWGKRNEDGTYNGVGCMPIACDKRSSKNVKVPNSGTSTYRLPGHQMRQFTVRETVTDSTREISTEQARSSGGTFNTGDLISLPVKTLRPGGGSGFSSSDVQRAMRGLTTSRSNCYDVDLVGIRWSNLQGKTASAEGKAVFSVSEENPAVPLLYPADSFVVELDSIVIVGGSPTECYGNIYHTSALIGDGTGELARLPVRWPTPDAGSLCSIYSRMTDSTGTFWVGETGFAFVAHSYIVDFTGRSLPGIKFINGQTATRGSDSIISNMGYMQVSMGFSTAQLSSVGFNCTAALLSTNQRLQISSIPRRHYIKYDYINFRFENSRFMGGSVIATVHPSRKHWAGGVWKSSATKSYVDSNYTLILGADADPARTDFAMSIRHTQEQIKSFGFRNIISAENAIAGRYPAYATFPPAQLPEALGRNALQIMNQRDLSGILITNAARTHTFVDSSRDVQSAVLNADLNRGGYILLGPGGVTGRLLYDAHQPDGSSVRQSLGRIGSSPSGTARFVSYVPDSDRDSKAPEYDHYFEFLHDVADSVLLGSRLRIPAPMNMSFDATDVSVTSLGDVPASPITFEPSQTRSNPWGLQIVPRSTTQTNTGFVAFERGVVNLTQAGFAEPIHFDKPFNIHLAEFLADGSTGKMVIDPDSPGQRFDGLLYSPETVRLSPIPDTSGAAAHLATTGHVGVPFFGAKYMHIIDASDSDTTRPRRSRYVTVKDNPFAGFPKSDLEFNKSDAIGELRFAMGYNDIGQDGFFGKGTLKHPALESISSELTVNRFSTCFRGYRASLGIQTLMQLKSMFNTIDSTWSCGCVEDDAFSTMAIGGRGQINAGGGLLASVNTGEEITIGLKDDIVTLWWSGAAQFSLTPFLAGDARLLLRGVYDRRTSAFRGTVNIDYNSADFTKGTSFLGELDLFIGKDRETSTVMQYLQGKAVVTLQALSLVGGSTQKYEGGLFLGNGVPTSKAWVIHASDSRFRLRDDFLTNEITGLYVYALQSDWVDYTLFAGRRDLFAGLGIVNLNVATSVGIDLQGSVFGGVLYGSALLNLQVALGAEIGFYGRGTFNGCFDSILWDKYCTDVGIGVGLTRAKGFYIE